MDLLRLPCASRSTPPPAVLPASLLLGFPPSPVGHAGFQFPRSFSPARLPGRVSALGGGHFVRCLPSHVMFHRQSRILWHRAILRQKSLPPLLHSIGIFAVPRLLSSSPLQTSVGPGCPMDGCLGQVWFRVCFSLVFLTNKPRYHNLPKGHVAAMHRSAVAPLGMKALCVMQLARTLPCTRPRKVKRRSA